MKLFKKICQAKIVSLERDLVALSKVFDSKMIKLVVREQLRRSAVGSESPKQKTH